MGTLAGEYRCRELAPLAGLALLPFIFGLLTLVLFGAETRTNSFILFLPENHIKYAFFSYNIYFKDLKVSKMKSKNSYKI